LLYIINLKNKYIINIIEAAASGDIALVRECIARGDDVNMWDEIGYESFVTSFNALIAEVNSNPTHGPSRTLSFPNSTGDDAIKAAARNGHAKIIEFLVEHGAKVNVVNPSICNDTALIVAAQNGHFNAVACLLKYGAKLEHKDATGNTALTYAVKKVVTGNTAVANQARAAQVDIVKILVEYGADVNAKIPVVGANKAFCTSLQTAWRNNNIEVAKILLVSGAYLSLEEWAGCRVRIGEYEWTKPFDAAKTVDSILYGKPSWYNNFNLIMTDYDGHDLAAGLSLLTNAYQRIDHDYIDLFAGRIIHHLTKTTKPADITSLENYLTANQAALPYAITQQTHQAIAIYKLPDSLLKADPYMADYLMHLDQAMISRIYDNFKNKALKQGIEVDYQDIINVLNPKLLPAALIEKITDLISEAEMDFAMFEAGWRSKIEHISPIPPLMLAKDKDCYGEEEYPDWTIEQKAWSVVESRDEATRIYYHNHPDEVMKPGAYFGRILESGVPDMRWNGIYDTFDSAKYILPAKCKSFLDQGSNRVKERNEDIKSIVDEVFDKAWRAVEINMVDQDDEVYLFGADEGWGGCVVS
jgi:hypothetical protein